MKIGLTSTIFGKILMPISYMARGDMRFKYFEQYKKNLSKSREEIKQFQLERLIRLVKHAYETVPYYKALFDSKKVNPDQIKTLEDFKKIPVLRKKDIIRNFESLKSTKKYTLIEVSSGGSTGNRVVVLKDKRYHEMSRAIVLRDFYSVGVQPGDKIAWVWGSPIENASLTKSMFHRLQWKLNRRIIFNSYSFTDESIEKWLKEDLKEFRPDIIYGYANSIYEIAKYVLKRKIIVPKLKKIICSAQKLEHREIIEQAFACKVIDHYGSREVETIAIEDDNYVMHSSDDFVFAEIGENHEIILTPLESYGMPLLRYVNGDIGIIKESKNHSESPFSEFNIKVGRSVEILRDKEGNKVYSGKINAQIAKSKLNIGEFQLVQKSYHEVELNIVKDELTSQEDIDKLILLIKETLGVEKVEIHFLKKFPIEKSGKKISYKCLIKDEDNNN